MAENQDILKDEIIILTGAKAIKTRINEHKLRLVSLCKEDENKVFRIITKLQSTGTGRQEPLQICIKMGYSIVFKAIKQNLQINTFIGTWESPEKSQIHSALISYL